MVSRDRMRPVPALGIQRVQEPRGIVRVVRGIERIVQRGEGVPGDTSGSPAGSRHRSSAPARLQRLTAATRLCLVCEKLPFALGIDGPWPRPQPPRRRIGPAALGQPDRPQQPRRQACRHTRRMLTRGLAEHAPDRPPRSRRSAERRFSAIPSCTRRTGPAAARPERRDETRPAEDNQPRAHSQGLHREPVHDTRIIRDRSYCDTCDPKRAAHVASD